MSDKDKTPKASKNSNKLVVTRLKPTMSRDAIRRNLYAALKANGITVLPNK